MQSLRVPMKMRDKGYNTFVFLALLTCALAMTGCDAEPAKPASKEPAKLLTTQNKAASAQTPKLKPKADDDSDKNDSAAKQHSPNKRFSDKREVGSSEPNSTLQKTGQPPDRSQVARQKPAIYRPIYRRPDHNIQRLQAAGFRRLNTEHVELITDLDAARIAQLKPALGQLHPFLESYFGPLPAARDGSEYKVTGYLMVDRNKFFAAGLAKETQVRDFHGRQIGAEFWLNNQSLDYYRRHLLLHETVHCYMRHIPNNDQLPFWYLEGMAEMIGTHRASGDKIEFGIMPVDRSRFEGLERIVLVQRDVKQNGIRTLHEITSLKATDFKNVESYAWSWALCRFLDSHPLYRKPFRELAKHLAAGEFESDFRRMFAGRLDQFATEWALFVGNIEHGFDFQRNQVMFAKSSPAPTVRLDLRTDRGWQSTGLTIEKGISYRVSASGTFTLANTPQPWVSEANGVTIRYVKGRPIGQLQGAIRTRGPGDADSPETMLISFPLGNEATFAAQATGTLFLRINDHPAELADNKGKLAIVISRK